MNKLKIGSALCEMVEMDNEEATKLILKDEKQKEEYYEQVL